MGMSVLLSFRIYFGAGLMVLGLELIYWRIVMGLGLCYLILQNYLYYLS